MAQILIVTDSPDGSGEVVYKERLGSVHLESAHFGSQLVERVNWAVRDAQDLERRAARTAKRRGAYTSPNRAGGAAAGAGLAAAAHRRSAPGAARRRRGRLAS